jgi:hypothetical protein
MTSIPFNATAMNFLSQNSLKNQDYCLELAKGYVSYHEQLRVFGIYLLIIMAMMAFMVCINAWVLKRVENELARQRKSGEFRTEQQQPKPPSI